MRPRLVLVFCIVALAVPGLALGQRTYVDSPRVEDSIGVSAHFTRSYPPKPGEIKMIADAGFRWVRTDFVWVDTDPGPARPRGYDFRFYDRLVEELDHYHLRAIFILDYYHCQYYNGESAKTACLLNEPESPHTEEQRTAFAQWAAAAASHFKGRGVYWEIYNEPNIDFWRSPSSEREKVNEYVKLAVTTSKAIRVAAPNETIIGPATAKIDLSFIGACLDAGLLDYWSGVSVHPYRESPPETAATDYEGLRQLIARYQPKGKKISIISGEWGYSAWGGTTEESQGKYLVRQFLSNLANDIQLSMWYDWRDDDWASGAERHFGTVKNPYNEKSDPVFAIKPAYRAAKTLTQNLGGYRLSKRVDVGSPNDYVLLFSNGGATRLAAWTTSTAHAITIPVKTGSFRVTGWRGETLPKQMANNRGLIVTLTDAPQYLIPE